MDARIISIEIEDENKYHADKEPKYTCKVTAKLMGAKVQVDKFPLSDAVAKQFADSFLYELQKRLCECNGTQNKGD